LVALAGEHYRCACGAELGRNYDGLAEIGPSIPYWGEIPECDMQRVLAAAAEVGWREAVARQVPEHLREYVASGERAAFSDVLPLPRGSRILDVGAGWGAIATALARHYEVTALEGVELRARFIALRARQDGLSSLRAIRGDVNTVPLALGQFDAIVANGVLEWVALLKTEDPPQAVQLQFLDRLRSLLRPGGLIYLAIENRIGWSELRGTPDHSGLPYTSLLPRPVARWVCAHNRNYRAQFNVGYRTYTYTHRGYCRLFRQVGLDVAATWISPSGYNRPTKLVPLDTDAIRFALRATGGAPPPAGVARLSKYVVWQNLRALSAHAGVWRWLGSDFVFLLRPVADAPPAHSEVAHA
jgi:2-polyprenyl-3-methyl-5-hydroxy-6-metoxy-1,4-benzoquinol methylase